MTTPAPADARGQPAAPSDPVQGGIEVTIAAETFTLLPQRAAYWHSARTLLLADLHLGKAETLRSLGAALPAAAILSSQLRQLSRAIEMVRPRRLLILGDLLHAPAGLTDDLIASVSAWRVGNDIRMQLIPGNHDRRIESIVRTWSLEVLDETHREGPFAFTHMPRPVEDAYAWCGHIHPAVTLRSGRDSLRLPCFQIGARLAHLPAFSRFTAGGPCDRAPGDRIFIIADDRVVAL